MVYAEPRETSSTFSAPAGRVQVSRPARGPKQGPTNDTASLSTRSACGCMALGIVARALDGRPEKASTSVVVAPDTASHRANFARYTSAPGSFHSAAATSSA
ncbi:hypothetical protein JOC24_005562 [Streptomyces sp. HB132]|nr:hypothetical protein [Streptomyces sp. HB132]